MLKRLIIVCLSIQIFNLFDSHRVTIDSHSFHVSFFWFKSRVVRGVHNNQLADVGTAGKVYGGFALQVLSGS